MAIAVEHTCESCGHSIESWSDGNPYYVDADGSKKYAYQDHEALSRCIGNDSPHLCLCCGHECMVDSRNRISSCPKCGAEKMADTWELAGKSCPYCKEGKFGENPSPSAIS
jgi:hypothetical protein